MRCMLFDRLAGPAAYLIEYNVVGILVSLHRFLLYPQRR